MAKVRGLSAHNNMNLNYVNNIKPAPTPTVVYINTSRYSTLQYRLLC